MKRFKNYPLAEFTSFGVGGRADELVICENYEELTRSISTATEQVNILGYGTNVLISDDGLRGTTIITRSNNVQFDNDKVIADSGVWWDDLVQLCISNDFYGLELLSGVPGGIGGAVFINITAYGQSASDSLEWIECYSRRENKTKILDAKSIEWGYKKSIFQTQEGSDLVILRACFSLSKNSTHELSYQSAVDVAGELGVDTENLESRRKIILTARERAGSLYAPGKGYEKTVGSFFRNPSVTPEQAEYIISFDESGKTKEQINKMNQVHGGDLLRVSAAHVMLAGGFSRGQSWGQVRLHPKNLLKIENAGGATAQQIYEVAQIIQKTVKQKLGVELVPEAQLLGKFE